MNVGATLAVARNPMGRNCFIYIYNIVGASIARPAVRTSEFAESQCESATSCRADEQCSPLRAYIGCVRDAAPYGNDALVS